MAMFSRKLLYMVLVFMIISVMAGITPVETSVKADQPLVYSQNISLEQVTTLSRPEIRTDAATSVSYFSATLNGFLTSLGAATRVNVFFKYDTTAIYGNTTSVQLKNTPGPYSINLTGLQPDTTYHFKAYAIDTANNTESGIGNGSDLTFTTLATSAPEVSTSPATNITSTGATLNGFLDSRGTATTVNVSFKYGLANSSNGYGSSTQFTPLRSAGSFSADVTGLTPNTIYYFRAEADGGLHGAAAPGADMTFTTPPIPHVVRTVAASRVSYDSVTLTGSLDYLGSAITVNVSFEYGTTASYGSTTDLEALTSTGTFNNYLSGLNPGTTYHFRARADGGINGITTGADMTFTTLQVTAPGVSTMAASGISYDRVTLNGRLDSLGTADMVTVTFECATDDYYIANNKTYNTTTIIQAMTVAGIFYYNVSSLTPDTRYHFRVKADAGVHGHAVGADMTFTTLPVKAPGVSTLAASGVSYDSVTLNGRLDSLGTAGMVEVTFECATDDYYIANNKTYNTTTIIQAMTGTGIFYYNVSCLIPGTRYHFRAEADGGVHGHATGADMTFTTLAVTAPGVSTSTASSVSYDRVTLAGNLSSLGTATTVNVSFEYGTTISYGNTTTVQAMTATGAFTFNLSGLAPGITYHFRAKADGGSHGYATGADMKFTTLPVTSPEVSTLAASGVNYNSVTLNGNLDFLGTTSLVNVFFEYGRTTSYGSITSTQPMTISDTFSANITGLIPGTTYHFRAKADGGVNGVNSGADMTFTTLTPPTVNTGAATSITFNSVTLKGNLASLGTAHAVNVFFEYGPTISYGSTTTFQTLTAAGTGTFNASVSGLNPGTLYHFRASADGGTNGTATGTDLTFTTLTIPALGTPVATNITTNSATLNGDISSLGSAAIVYISFEYGLTTNYGSTTPPMAIMAPGTFSANITGLSPGTTYHFRERADGGASGIATGPDVTFTTVNIPPGVSTSPATGITTNAVTLNGNLASLGTATTVYVSFEYGLTTNYGSTTIPKAMTGSGMFSADLSGLNPGATYHFRAMADGGDQGITSGADISFTTINIPPGISTSPATGITTNEVTLNGNLASLGTATTVKVSFEYGLTTNYGSSTVIQAMTAAGTFKADLSGLNPGTTYHFRAKADGGRQGTANGDDATFTTINIPPAVSTAAATSIIFDGVTLNGNLTSLGTATTVNVSFEYGLTTSYGNTVAVQAMSATGTFTASLSGLNPGTTYHFRAKADGGGQGTTKGADMMFTTLTPPTVNTSAATSITFDSVRLNGALSSLGTASTVNVSFEYGTTTGYGSTTTDRGMSATGTFNANLSGLSPATTYHFRAKADGGVNGTIAGSDLTFTTLTPPIVNTDAATSITFDSVTLKGNLSSLGTATTVNVSFEYGLTTSYGSTTIPQAMTAAGIYNANLNGLSPGTTYHFRAKADGGLNGTFAGSDMTFTTLTTPTVNTNAAKSIFNNVTLNGYLTSLGTAATVNVSFEYGLDTSYGSTTTDRAMIATGNFTASLSGLSSGTIYHFRAKADGGINGVAAGSDMNFTTAEAGATPPEVSTLAATSITTNSATISGNLTSLGTASTVNVSFEYGLTPAYGAITEVQAITAMGAFSVNLTGLIPGTVYHFVANADGGVNGTAAGSDMAFTTTTVPPAISTIAAMPVTTNSATLNGNLTSLGTASTVNVSFEYGLTPAYGATTVVQAMTTTGVFSFNLTGLTPATTYHFRAVADGGAQGDAAGADMAFMTAGADTMPPEVSTLAATSITANSATINGNLASLGTASTVSMSIEYGLTTAYGRTTTVQAITATGAFHFRLTGLTPVTIYHFRVKADGGVSGIVIGEDITFNTQRSVAGGSGGGGGGSSEPSLIKGLTGQVSWTPATGGLTPALVIVTSLDGKCTVSIAKGTQVHDSGGKILHTISCSTPKAPVSPPRDATILAVYDLTPSGASFSPMVTITIKYDPASLPLESPETGLKLGYYDTITEAWIFLDKVTINAASSTITGASEHFTQFAVLAAVAPEPTPSPTPIPTPTPTPTLTLAPAPAPSTIPTPTISLIPTNATSPASMATPLPAITPEPTKSLSASPSATQSRQPIPILAVIIGGIAIGGLAGLLAFLIIRRSRRGKALTLLASFAEVYNYSNSQYRLKKYDLAIAGYTKAIELDSSKAMAYLNRGAAYCAKGDYEKALTDQSAAITLDPNDVTGYYDRGMVYKAMDRREEAIADFEKVIMLNQNQTLSLEAEQTLEGLSKA